MDNYSSLLNLLSGMDSSQAEGTSGISPLIGGNRKLWIWVFLFIIFYCFCCNRGYGNDFNNCCCCDCDDCCCDRKHKKHKCKECCCIEIDPCCFNNRGGNWGSGNGIFGCGINICTIAILAAIFLIRKGC